MNFPIIREYRTDLRNTNPENEVRQEPFSVEAGVFTRVIVPTHSPFFVESLKLYFPNGEKMVKDTHYRIYRLMGGLTALTSQRCACMIELLDEDITDGLLDYDIVGEFTLFDTTMLSLVTSSDENKRPVFFDNITNKPVVWPPLLHKHSIIKDIVAWGDMIELIDLIMGLCTTHGRQLIEVKITHYFNLFNNYLKMYGDMLKDFLARHVNTHNHHGLTKAGVGLPLVDNYPTASGVGGLEARSDMHLTVSGLKAIIDEYGFNPDKYTKAGTLPISQFGNTNFIPPSIDGSFEGLGGMAETAGICMEPDGSLVFLENRMDGRINGLYFSVVQTPYNNPRRIYTGYRYNHPRFEADDSIPDKICQGSGSEVILVGDSSKQFFYLGLTNGSLDPSKHVYSRVNLEAFRSAWPETERRISDMLEFTNVVLMGNWIYLFVSSYYNQSAVADSGSGMNYRYVYRVAKSVVAAQNPATAVATNVSFKDTDGQQWNNTPVWRWGTQVRKPGGNELQWSKWYFPFKQTEGVQTTGIYRSQHTLVAEIPTKPGKFLLRFCGAWWSVYVVPGRSQGYELMIEALYEFDPATGTMTLLSQTPKVTIDYDALPPDEWRAWNALVFVDRCQGSAVLEDGTVVASYGAYQSFPRGMYLWRPRDTKTRYDMMNRQWNTAPGVMSQISGPQEEVISPLKSTVKPRSFLLGNKGDFYTAPDPATLGARKMYYRVGNGKLAIRPEVSNLFYPNTQSRPLSNDVREVRGGTLVGGAMVTVPSAQLDSFGIDLAENAFCMGVQRRYMDPAGLAGQWPYGTNLDDVKFMTGHTRKIETDGTITIVPTGSILYPAAIVNQLKLEVDDIAGMQACPSVMVTICDPTGPLTSKFGWLPTLVMINWAKQGTTNRRATFLSITPTLSGGANRTVSGYTVLDKYHWDMGPNTAAALTADYWDATVWGHSPNSTHGSMRTGYHVNGNEIIGYFDAAVYAASSGDGLTPQAKFTYADRTTKRWTNVSFQAPGEGLGGGHLSVAPDEGVIEAIAHSISTGGAGTLFMGGLRTSLLGSVYPETGWTVFFQAEIKAVFNGKAYMMPSGSIDLRDVEVAPANKTFYIYAVLEDDQPVYQITQEKRLESPFQVWVAKAVTNDRQIVTIERYNVFTLNGNRVSELKRGNAIPASAGAANAEGQFPWLRTNELLP